MSFGRLVMRRRGRVAMESREKEEKPFPKLRERKKIENGIFWCLNQIDIPSRAITKLPLS
jgi:hypothetical protein